MTEATKTDDIMTTSNLELATELTIAWLGNPNVRATAEEVPAFLRTMHGTLAELAGSAGSSAPSEEAPAYTPAVSPRGSVKRDHIISLIDGKPYKTLKRHLAGHGLTPADYRQRYGLKPDYPMVAPSYSEQRREMAKKIGLGRKAGTKAPRRRAAPKA
jgi:predicted transcriptional regulator